MWFYYNGENLRRGSISDVLWHPFFFPRWCVYEFPSLDWLCSWKHNFLLNYWSKYMNRSFGILVYWPTYLGHNFRSNGGIWFCYKTYFCKIGGICEKTMSISCWLTYYRIARLIPGPKLDGCIWYCVSIILATTRAENKVCCSFGNFQKCHLLV